MVTSITPSSKSFKLLFWNLLCDEYSAYWKVAQKVELKYKKWNYRRELFKKILTKSSVLSDCYCFVEVDKQKDILSILNSTNSEKQYELIYYPRPNTPLGQCFIYDKAKFELIDKFQYFLTNDPKMNFALVVCLKEIREGYTVALVVTHLTAWEKHEQQRVSQVKSLMASIANDSKFSTYRIDNFIICGDYNADPIAPCVKLMGEKYKSVFDLKEGIYTIVIDTVDEGIKKMYYDYIFYSGKMTVEDKQMPTEDLDYTKGIPNEQFPSDHLYLTCTMRIDS